MTTGTQSKLNMQVFKADLARFAEISEVSFNEKAVQDILDVFGDFYEEAIITVRTTTHPKGKRDVNFRYMEMWKPHNPFEMLQTSGLLSLEGHPIEKVIPEVLDRFPVWWGVDVAVSHGFEKIWLFLKNVTPLSDILTLSCLPPSVHNYREHFKTFAQDDALTIIGLDFKNKSMNFYPGNPPPGSLKTEKIAAMIADLDFAPLSDEMLQRGIHAANMYYTFTWDSPKVQRLCFVIPSPAEAVPVHWNPLFKNFVENAPFQTEQRMFAYNLTFGPTGGYAKIEADYVGRIEKVFTYWN